MSGHTPDTVFNPNISGSLHLLCCSPLAVGDYSCASCNLQIKQIRLVNYSDPKLWEVPMSTITNAPRRNYSVLKAIRGTLEHRATWLYLLLKEGEKKGIAWEDIGKPAIRACGTLHGIDCLQNRKKSIC
jgi:hypothetical protein